MKKILFFIITIFFISHTYAIEYETICKNNQLNYSLKTKKWSIKEDICEDSNINNNYQITEDICTDKSNNKNIDFEFIYKSRLIGVDNKNLKFYETIYNNEKFEQKELTADEVQQIFTDIDVIKLSDFKKGIYTVLSNNEQKEILLINDTNINLEEYCLITDKNAINKEIKSLIKLPKKGKVSFVNLIDRKEQEYIIKIK